MLSLYMSLHPGYSSFSIKAEDLWKLQSCLLVSTNEPKNLATATVTMVDPSGETKTLAAVSTGPVRAIYTAIDRIVGERPILEDYHIDSVGPGRDAIGEVSVRISEEGGDTSFRGIGSDPDVLIASAEAYVSAINALHSARLNPPSVSYRETEADAAAI